MTTWALAIGFTSALYSVRKTTRLSFVMSARLAHWGGRAFVIALALIAEFAQMPVINALDRVVRINW